MNRISHPDWVKLSVELNLRAKPKYEISLHYNFIHIFYPSHDNFLVMDEFLPKNDQTEMILLKHVLFQLVCLSIHLSYRVFTL